ncbi:potassium channel family protein [Streptomyces spirodelae]|uniref:Potassium channel family protein n=1 Tax=Streptomyces spirodelae TaxID=2812904 RepID=A0ABS3WRV3_9ACTN|nr:potassium channel family protein [Streptomyces spirodelae]MBO8185846.1 potassium channel family protein [Streptomyces spirodelae]
MDERADTSQPETFAAAKAAPEPPQRFSAVDVALTGAVLVFLVAYAWPILQPDLSHGWRTACVWAGWITWGVFALDYVVRLVRATDRRAYFKSHLFALATVVLPVFRPLRMLRLLTVMSVLNRRAAVTLRGQVTTYAAGATGLLMLCGALAVLDAERGAEGATIESFPDAVWWTFATVTTVGYGDYYPVTPTGRLVAVLLMIAGIAVLGVVSASLASWFIERVSAAGAEQETATRQEISELTEIVRAQQRQLEEQRALLTAAGVSDNEHRDLGAPSAGRGR